MKIELKKLRFFAFHGMFVEEKKTGNDYEVNLRVSYNTKTGLISDISETINYAELHNLVKNEMMCPTELLETVAMSITTKIKAAFHQVSKIEIEILKLNPPIEKFQGQVGVSYQVEY